MLTDDQFNNAYHNQLQVKSPGGFMVWIDETHNLFFDDVDTDDEKEVNITRYTDENGRKRLIDTQTFKEFFIPESRVLYRSDLEGEDQKRK